MADINRMMRGSVAIYCEVPKAVADDISYMLRTGAEEIKTLRTHVARLEDALTQILGWRELRDTRAFPVGRAEEIARRALEEKGA